MKSARTRPSRYPKNGENYYSRTHLFPVSILSLLTLLECKGTTIHLLKQGSKPVATQYKRQRIEIAQTPDQFREEAEALQIQQAKLKAEAEMDQFL